MDMEQIRALYTHHQRINIHYEGMMREETPHVVRCIGVNIPRGYISYLKPGLTSAELSAVIREQIAFYSELGQAFEWKVFDMDKPADLKAQLAANGFDTGEDEAILVLDLENLPEKLSRPTTHDIRRITDPDAASDVLLAVQNRVFGDGRASWVNEFIKQHLIKRPDYIQVFAACVDDAPVSAGWVIYEETGPFATLYGGATLEAHRGQGLYTALIATRAKHAAERGVRFLTVDASPMSRPILERIGFRLIAMSWECNYELR